MLVRFALDFTCLRVVFGISRLDGGVNIVGGVRAVEGRNGDRGRVLGGELTKGRPAATLLFSGNERGEGL